MELSYSIHDKHLVEPKISLTDEQRDALAKALEMYITRDFLALSPALPPPPSQGPSCNCGIVHTCGWPLS